MGDYGGVVAIILALISTGTLGWVGSVVLNKQKYKQDNYMSWQTRYDELQDRRDKEYEELRAYNQGLNDKYNQLFGKYEALFDQGVQKEKEMVELRAQIISLEKENISLKSQLNVANKKIEELQGITKATNTRMNDLNN